METTQQHLGASSTEQPSSGAESTARVSQRAHEVVDRVATSAHTMADRMSRQGEQWMVRQDELMQQVRGYVREKPIAALAIAAVVGFVLSRLSR